MIKVLEQDLLNDSFINKAFVNNIKLNDKIIFKKENIYYFGNYDENNIEKIKKKLQSNKKNILNAVDKGIRFIICGNSTEIFNNNFNTSDLNIYTSYNKNIFKKKLNGIKFKKHIKKNKIKKVFSLNTPIDSENFRYKNLLCIKDINKIF